MAETVPPGSIHSVLAASAPIPWELSTLPNLHRGLGRFSASYAKMHGHPSHDLRERLEPHTTAVEQHKIRWWKGKDSSYNLSDYDEATYCTARSGTIVIKNDGQSYEVLYKD